MLGKLTLDTELRTTKFENKLDKLEKDLDVAERKAEQAEEKFNRIAEAIDATPTGGSQTKEFLALAEAGDKASIELDKAKNNVEDIKNKIVETRLEMDKTEFDRKGKNLTNANRLIKKLKQVGLAVFSIRGAYSLLSRASSAYLSKDTELAQKLQNVWVGLGSILSPVLEYMSNLMLKALGYLNVFIKTLTGIDFIAKANAKALNKQASAQKNLNKQMLSFDEINKLSDTSTSGSTNVGGTIDIPELDNNVIAKLQDMAYWLKENWSWLEKVGIALGIVFGAVKIAGIIKNIGTLIGIKGIGGLTSSLNGIPTAISIGLTLVGVTAIISEILYIKDQISELESSNEKFRKSAQKNYATAIKNLNDINGIIDEQNQKRAVGNSALEDSYKWYYKIFGLDKESLKTSGQIVYNSQVTLDKLKEQYEMGKLSKEEQDKILKAMIDQYNYNLAMIKILDENGIKTNDLVKVNTNYAEEIKKVSDGLGLSRDKLGEMIIKSSEEKDLTKGIYDNIANINKTPLNSKSATYTITAKADTSQATKDYSNFFSKLGGSISAIFTPDAWKNNIVKSISNIWKGKKLATGGIVYNPGAGVPVGRNVVAGEAGAEGVLPLTNPETMATLGKEIGKWITLNMNITNQIDGRVLNKRLETIKREDDFSTNGGVL